MGSCMEKKERAKRNLKFFLSAVGLLMVFIVPMVYKPN